MRRTSNSQIRPKQPTQFAHRFQRRRFARFNSHRRQHQRVPCNLRSDLRARALDNGEYKRNDASRNKESRPQMGET